MLQKTSSIAIAAALAVFAGAAVAQDQNSTTTGTQIQPPAASDTSGADAGTAPAAGAADSAQTDPAAGAATDMGTAQTAPAAGSDTNTGTAETMPPAGTDMNSGTAEITEPSTTPDAATAQTPAAGAATDTATASAGATQEFLTQQGTDQFLGSDLMGAKVRSAANEDIGEVNDVLFDMQGRSVAIIVGVGGFLGIGEKDVAIPFDRFTVGHEEGDLDDIMISLDTTKDELNGAPEFETVDDDATATSATEGVTPAPNDTGSTLGSDPAMTPGAAGTEGAPATEAPAANQ